jgi:hypothetical protein
VRRSDDATALLRHERPPLEHPRIDDELARLPLEVAQHGVDGDGRAGDDGRRVCVDERRQLLAIGSPERTHLDRRHREPPRDRRDLHE